VTRNNPETLSVSYLKYPSSLQLINANTKCQPFPVLDDYDWPLINRLNCIFGHVSHYLLYLKRYYKFPRAFPSSTNLKSSIQCRFVWSMGQVMSPRTTHLLNFPSKFLNLWTSKSLPESIFPQALRRILSQSVLSHHYAHNSLNTLWLFSHEIRLEITWSHLNVFDRCAEKLYP
jgi:hypothetical protein